MTHADGTPVSAESPAKAGETVIIYAFGLGHVTPAVKTGEATPIPAPVLYFDSPFFGRTVDLQYDFRVNASPSRPYLNPIATGPVRVRNPRFAGLTPGEVGLYQINVTLPDAFPPVERCTSPADKGTLSSIFFPVVSNLTIDLGGISSFDGAAICVQPQ